VAIKVRIPHRKNGKEGNRGFRDPVFRFALAAFAVLALLFVSAFSFFYVKYDRIIERRFK